MDHRQGCISFLVVATNHDRPVFVAEDREIILSLPAIGHDGAPRLYRSPDKGLKRRFASIRHSRETEAARVTLAFTFAVWLYQHSNFDGRCNQHLVSDAPSFSMCSPADKGLVNLNMPVRSYSFSLGSDHRPPEFVQNLEGCFVSFDPELALKLNRRQPRGMACHKVSSPKPNPKWRSGPVHNGSRREVRVSHTAAAPQHGRPVRKTIGVTDCTALQAYESLGPTQPLQVCSARCFARESPLELWQCFGKGLTQHRPILSHQALGVNRIDMPKSTA